MTVEPSFVSQSQSAILTRLLLLSLVIMLPGCAAIFSPPAPARSPGSGEGFITTVASVRAGSTTSPGFLRFLLLRRCARVTIANGFDYFVIRNSGFAGAGDISDGYADQDASVVAKATITMYKGQTRFTIPDTYDAADVVNNRYTNPQELDNALLGVLPPVYDDTNRLLGPH